MKAVSNELGAFMMWIVDDRFALHIMNKLSSLLTVFMKKIAPFMMWIVM
jgi:hypothetical protein